MTDRPTARSRATAPVPPVAADAQVAPPLAGRGRSAGGPVVVRHLRSASRTVGDAVTRIRSGLGGAREPVLLPGPWEGPGSFTPGPAGWFALAVEAGSTGFRLDGRPLGAAELARAIWRCPRWRGRPVLLVTQPSAATDGAGPVLRQLAVDLGTLVYASDAGVRFGFGRALADRQFWCFRPGGEGDEPEPVGPVLPPVGPVLPPAGPVLPPMGLAATARGTGPSRSVPGVVAASIPASIPAPPPGVQPLAVPAIEVPRLDLDIRRMGQLGGATPPPPPVVRRPRLAVPGTTVASAAVDPATEPADAPGEPPAVGPPWVVVEAQAEGADRERIRTFLDWKYETHSRAVSRALSLHPGLRNAAGPNDVLVGLIAVLALLDGVGARVNSALRGTRAPTEEDLLLARCAAAGLAQLSAVAGAVFATGPAGLDVAGLYRPGELVVEPAFTEVSMGPASDGPEPRFAIWSATARRLDQLRTAQEVAECGSRAMFAAGTRFAVLGVETTEPDGAPCVLLREVVVDRGDGRLDERVASRLRAARAAGEQQTTRLTALPWPLGIADGGQRFPVGPDPTVAGRPVPPHAADDDGRSRR